MITLLYSSNALKRTEIDDENIYTWTFLCLRSFYQDVIFQAVYAVKFYSEISGIGPKSFEQCAGFLFIYVSDSQSSASEPSKKKRKIASSHPSNPLDSTPVHPESYQIAKKQIGTETVKQKLLSAEKEIRDRGSEWTLSDVMKVDSLHVDQVLNGVVVNHVQFGVFIDIGVGCDALAHQSTLPPIPPP
ncbi:unnamed protein product, partial [Anisakis simplex]|uniref:HHH_9 domain-containing protein n=1 Tax=Anisakis simplex TaxID=6269 RepID=A0A0M3KK61_ANISI